MPENTDSIYSLHDLHVSLDEYKTNAANGLDVALTDHMTLGLTAMKATDESFKMLAALSDKLVKVEEKLRQEAFALSVDDIAYQTHLLTLNAAIGQLNQATQQNAPASEELAATAEEPGNQAQQLQERMTFFQWADSGRRSAAMSPMSCVA